MKFTILAFLCFLVGCGKPSTAPAASSGPTAIARVLNERLAAEQASTYSDDMVRGIDHAEPALRSDDYLRALHRISTSNCPPDFRQVWSDYVYRWDKKTSASPAEKISGLLRAKHGDLSGLQASQSSDEWHSVVRSALGYGVEAPTTTNTAYFDRLDR